MTQKTYLQAANEVGDQLKANWLKAPKNASDIFWITGNILETFLYNWSARKIAFDGELWSSMLNYYHTVVPENASDAFLKELADKGLHGENGGMWLDDYGWWGNAFLVAFERANALKFTDQVKINLLKDADNCWKLMTLGWDTANTPPIPGGVYNCKRFEWALTGRNSVTNLQYWLLCLRLYAATNNPSYLDPQRNILQWFITGFNENRLFDSTTSPVRERMKGEHGDTAQPGFYWAGDQGLFLLCSLTEKRATPPAFKELLQKVLTNVINQMVDDSSVLHDHIITTEGDIFDNDYATGKGVFMRNVPAIFRATQYGALAKCLMQSANHAYLNKQGAADQFSFSWNPTGKMPIERTDWDTNATDTVDAFRGVILDACGVSVISAAAELDPNGVINLR